MKVKCVRNKLDFDYQNQMNSDMREYLEINTEFDVFGMRFCSNVCLIYIYNGNHLFEVPIEFFDIIDRTILFEWHVKKWDNGDYTIWPEFFYMEDFFENFSERDERERLIFAEYCKRFK